MNKVNSTNGQYLREMFAAATNWLEKSVADIDALNVFPVPDGDTGTNMLFTMRSSVEEAYRNTDQNAATVAQAIAKGALMGARGNSGVILSQIWRGLARGLDSKETFSGEDFARALEEASRMAYKGLSNPVEGTILTVVKDAARAAQIQAGSEKNDLVSVIEAATKAAAESLANTPNLLPVLKEAGVVDAGGQGLYTILEGILHYVKGEMEQLQFRRPWIVASSVPLTVRVSQVAAEEVPYGYCTEFLLKGEKLAPDKVRKRLEKKGESIIVVGDESDIRIHIHTLDPGSVVTYATSMGTMHQVSIRNMDEQRRDFYEKQKEKLPSVDIATIAVVAGEGLTDVFNSLGVTAVVPGGQTMNPSTKDLLNAVESTGADKVIILPNNKNIILTAQQVQPLTQKTVAVIPTETIPQGVAVLLAFDYEADFDSNVELMKKAVSSVKSIEITRAVRAAKINSFDIKKRQAIGFVDGNLAAVANTPAETLNQVLQKINLSEAEVVTIYYGAGINQPEAEKIGASIREQFPHLQCEVIKGGQPHYEYIISIE